MSRVGGKPIPIPKNVKITLSEGKVMAEGPKGKLLTAVPPGVQFAQEDDVLKATPENDSNAAKPFWGLARSLVANAVAGVSEGFSRELDIVGIGYRAQLEGKTVQFALGYSHPVEFPIPEGIQITIDKNTHIVVSGADKQLVGQTAANIRSLRKPDPYKQKGIRYTGEQLKKKAGKTGVS